MAKKAHVLSLDEFNRLIKIVSQSNHSKRDVLLLLMSYGLGLRAVELAALKIKDIFSSDGSIRETLTLSRTKGDIKRDVFLVDQRIKKAILEYIEIRKNRKSSFSHEQALFLSQKHGHFSNVSLVRRFENLYKMAGIKGASSHSGRRTFATNLIEKGMDIKSVSVLMGHSNIQMTSEYIQENPERLKRITMEALY